MHIHPISNGRQKSGCGCPHSRSFQVNNILIVNLAVSDLLLCTVVSPMTLVEILFKRWTGPNAQVVCQLSGMVPVCVTFVSTLTITGIAIDG